MFKEKDFEGSCPICYIGEVESMKCGRCGAIFCLQCGGVTNKESENIAKCKCRENN